jgi:hypothetical protein
MQAFYTEPVFIAYNVAHRCWHKYSLCMFIKVDSRFRSLLFSVLIICLIDLFIFVIWKVSLRYDLLGGTFPPEYRGG